MKEEDDGNNNISDDNNKNTLCWLTERHCIRRRALLQHRSNSHEDALSIETFANSLELSHLISSSADNNKQQQYTIVSNAVSEVRIRESDSQWHLLQRLNVKW